MEEIRTKPSIVATGFGSLPSPIALLGPTTYVRHAPDLTAGGTADRRKEPTLARYVRGGAAHYDDAVCAY